MNLAAEIPENSIAAQQRLQISELQCDRINSHTFNVFMLEDKIQNPGEFMF